MKYLFKNKVKENKSLGKSDTRKFDVYKNGNYLEFLVIYNIWP